MRAAVTLLLLVVILATVAPAAARPGSVLNTYLREVRSPCAQLTAGESLTGRGIAGAKADSDPLIGHGVYTNAIKLLRQAEVQLQFAYVGISVVVAPPGLAEPQANLRRGIRREQRAADSLLKVLLEPASETKNEVDVPTAVVAAQGGVDAANVAVSDWRDELTVRLRRQGLTVPLWLKRVGR